MEKRRAVSPAKAGAEPFGGVLPTAGDLKIVAKRLAERGYIIQDTPPAIGKDYNDYLLAARRLISMER